MNTGLRHGENVLLPVKTMQGETKEYKTYIVGHSETGHHHVLESLKEFDVAVFDDDLYLRLFEPAKLVHKKQIDKHNTLTVKPGIYRVFRKSEYDPWTQVMREVWD